MGYATVILWNQANPMPRSPESSTGTASPGLPDPGIRPEQSSRPVRTTDTPAGCWQKIDPVGDHVAGGVLSISGTTNCPPGDRITVEIVSVPDGTREYINGSVEIIQRSDASVGWSVTIDSSSFSPGQTVVSACGVGICGFESFNITERTG